MPREMSKQPARAYRAVLVWRRRDGREATRYQGPYWVRSAASARVTVARNEDERRKRYGSWSPYGPLVSSYVETAALGPWEVAE